MGCEGKESERRLEEESCRVCAVGASLFSPARPWWWWRVPTCQLVGFSTCREVGKLAGCGRAQGGGEEVLQGADIGWRI